MAGDMEPGMSLETLLEAAKYVELSTHTKKAREHDAQDFHPYAKSAPPNHKRSSGDGSSSPDKGSDDGQKRRYGGAGTREVHNKLEKNRRAHLKECFESLKRQVPNMEDKKTSNLSILRGALRHIQTLKRKEREYEQQMQTLAQEKIQTQERIAVLKRELAQMNIEYDINMFLRDEETDSDSTATADRGSPIISDDEGEIPGSPTPKVKPPAIAPPSQPKAPPASSPAVLRLNKELHPSPAQRGLTLAAAAPKSVVVKFRTDKESDNTRSEVVRTVQPTDVINKVEPIIAGGSLTTSAAATSATTATSSPATTINRTPVAQILHQAITQRAALQQQKLRQQEYVVTLPSTLVNATITTIKPLSSGAQLQQAALPITRLVSPGGTLVAPVSMLAGSSPAATLTNISKLVATAATTQAVSTIPSTGSSTVSAATIQTKPTSAAVAIPNLAAVKHLIATPFTGAQILTPTAAQLSQLMSQAIARTTLAQVVTTTTSSASAVTVATPLITPGLPSVITSLGQLTPVTQLLSPVTLVSPAMQVAGNLGQGQLGSLTNNSVIKPLAQIPIMQSFNLQSQPLLKPVVMVPGSLLSAAALPTTSAPTVHVTIPVSRTS